MKPKARLKQYPQGWAWIIYTQRTGHTIEAGGPFFVRQWTVKEVNTIAAGKH